MLLEAVQNIDGFFELGDVHDPKPAVGACNANLASAGTDLGERLPVGWYEAALNEPEFAARLPTRIVRKRLEVIKRCSAPVNG